jgi:hypothetical protein
MATAGAEPGGLTRCARCGAEFVCGMLSGEPRCWCAELPSIEPVPGRSCLCRECLLDERRVGQGPPYST